MKYVKIPNSLSVGGVKLDIKQIDQCLDNNLGNCYLSAGYIEISNKIDRDNEQSDGSKINTFYHELTHAILRTMGEFELNSNEKFVCCLSSFLAEAMEKAVFEEEDL